MQLIAGKVAIIATEKPHADFVPVPLLDEVFQLVMLKGHCLKLKRV